MMKIWDLPLIEVYDKTKETFKIPYCSEDQTEKYQN